ncbi:MAG: Jag N-terminal domain-containing protein [Deltaproteobacteria bacterium]|jgi:spoIIIJ-associated protein|nr:Jag N-terminal domain-containing protein [Deltaproteobacteria bacterium]
MRDDYKEFTGKTLDEAMSAACSFYGLEREKLEIEIISDAAGGIFGLMGAKKAIVRARRVHLENMGLRGRPREEKELSAPAQERAARVSPPGEAAGLSPLARTESPAAPEPAARASAPAPGEGPDGEDSGSSPDKAGAAAGTASRFEALNELDQDLLKNTVLEAVSALTLPIVGETGKTLEIFGDRVRVRLETDEDPGLLIGREGQTLFSLQYLVSCIVSRRLGSSVRVQIDAGDYRERQLEALRELALHLAGKVRDSGRPHSTRPLGAYQRRIIHITLQDDPGVQTHSKGEGALKRVIIVPRQIK